MPKTNKKKTPLKKKAPLNESISFSVNKTPSVLRDTPVNTPTVINESEMVDECSDLVADNSNNKSYPSLQNPDREMAAEYHAILLKINKLMRMQKQ